MKVEHTGGVKSMTDEQLEAGIEAIRAMLAEREAASNAKLVEAVAEPIADQPDTPALPSPPSIKRRRKRDKGIAGEST